VVIHLASDLDGSLPLICATVDARDRVWGSECFGGTPTEIGARAFMRIDFENKSITRPKRITPTKFMEKSAQQLLLQGAELGYGWDFALEQTTGRFSASLTNLHGAFLLFGSCTLF
jgi:hypothetical protein